ncbi:MAG: DUF1127 domain-containing protein [Stellaceae bacterium]
MTAMNLLHTRVSAGGACRRGRGHPLVHALATLREWHRRSRDRERLAHFDDRMLRDIGLTHADADRLANKPFWRE